MTHPLVCRRLMLLDGVALHVQRDDVDETFVADLPHGVQRLVAHLALSGRPARPAVAAQLWPDGSEEQAQRNLRTSLWRVQKAVPGLVQSSGGALWLCGGVQVDVQELTEWGRRVLSPGTRLDDGFTPHPGLYGELLPGWYDDWVLRDRERLRQLRMHAWETLADKLARAGRFGEAVEAAHEAIRWAPLRESAHRTLIRIHVAEGNIGEALLVYTRFEEQLADQLGMAPSPQLEDLILRLTRARAAHRGARGQVDSPSLRNWTSL